MGTLTSRSTLNCDPSKKFDNQYYVDLIKNAWRPRNRGRQADGGPPQDWTMLNPTGTTG